ncbi:MAG: hypothetical protein Q8M24_10165 [Pseudolabrys sp.]|nr:hypothetical protein [Pseudolabrys sp.]MDP2295811.1 hypothetical protein [Pseudolabrys sp.]
MVSGQPGILSIWNDVAPGRDADFDTWFQGEHLAERLAVPGFLFGRRHQAISGARGYFNFYLVESSDVLTSKPYLERLDNPTPMTRMIMADVFKNMNRTLCHRALRRGALRGAYAVTVRFTDTPNETALAALLDELLADINIASGEIWLAVDPAGQPVSLEEKIRGGDRKIKGALLIDTLREADAEALGARLAKEFPNGEVGVFRVLCQLGHGEAFEK